MPIVFVTAPPAPNLPQPSFANVRYLPDHENAADESTAITDLSTGGGGSPHTFSFVGNTKNDDAETAFGSGTSILFPGTDDWITRSYHVDFRPTSAESQDTDEFCFEMHVRLGSSGDGDLYSRYNASTNNRIHLMNINSSSIPQFGVWENGTTQLFSIAATTVLSVGTWYHVAVCRENDFTAGPGNEDIVRIFVDGIQENSIALDSNEGMNQVGLIGPRFGDRESGGGDFDGRLDNIRIVIGEPIYIENFDPPTARHPTS